MAKIIVTINQLDDILNFKNADVFVVANNKFAVKYPASFSCALIKDAIKMAHSLNKEIYLSINKVYLNDELDDLKDFIKTFNNIDGYLVADLGAFHILKNLGLGNKTIYSPETLIVNYYDMNACFDMGMKSVVLSKEMTLQNIEDSIKVSKGNVIVYSFGYYHMFYSRRKLVKNYFDFINEEDKHQYEHLYLKEQTRDNMYHIYQDDNGTIICNSDIFCNIDYLDDINADYFIDSYDLDSAFVNKVIDIYKRHISGEAVSLDDIKNIDDKKSYTTGFLFRKIGAR